MTTSHDQVLAELEAANRDLQTEQHKVISLQNQLKLGSSSSIVLAEVNLPESKFSKVCGNLKMVHCCFFCERSWYLLVA